MVVNQFGARPQRSPHRVNEQHGETVCASLTEFAGSAARAQDGTRKERNYCIIGGDW